MSTSLHHIELINHVPVHKFLDYKVGKKKTMIIKFQEKWKSHNTIPRDQNHSKIHNPAIIEQHINELSPTKLSVTTKRFAAPVPRVELLFDGEGPPLVNCA